MTQFFARDQYNEASICYRRSKNEKGILICSVYIDWKTALTFKAEKRSLDAYKPLFIRAGDGFCTLEKFLDASQCYIDGEEPAYENTENRRAAEIYFNHGHHFKSLNVCLRFQLLNLAVEFLSNMPPDVDQANVEKYSRFFALQWYDLLTLVEGWVKRRI
jgi:hypothetical protein